MSGSAMQRIGLAAGLVLALAPVAAGARQLIYSYDSVTPVTEAMTQSGLTFVFDKSLMATRVRKIMETQTLGEADVQPVSEQVLGESLRQLIGEEAGGHQLYAITTAANGPALERALCPGAAHAYLAIGLLRSGRDLTVEALGTAPGRPAWLCVTLSYGFHGEWALPPTALSQPDRSDRFNDQPANRPY
jgi:hypothetical protein